MTRHKNGESQINLRLSNKKKRNFMSVDGPFTKLKKKNKNYNDIKVFSYISNIN